MPVDGLPQLFPLKTGDGSPLRAARILIIGLDGGTWTVLTPACENGFMPRLHQLAKQGRSGVLTSVIPAITPAAWCSFQTGSDPGMTGIADFTRWDRPTAREVPVDVRRLPAAFWERAGEAGHRVGVVNLPMTWPPRKVNGFLVSGLLTPSTDTVFTHPPELGPELLSAVPGYHIFNLETAVDESDRESLEAFLDFVAATVSIRAEAACWLMHRHPVEVLMVQFQATDIVQHVLWHYLDPGHERFDAVKCELILERFYGALDRALAKVLDAFTAQDREPPVTLVVSDHGFQRHDRRFNLWRWLTEEGWLVPALGLDAGSGPAGAPGSSGTPGRHPADPASSRAIPTGRSNEAFIWMPALEPAERERSIASLKPALEAVRDPVDGARLVAQVHRREDIWSGSRLAELPDLVVVPTGPVSITGRFEPGTDLITRVEPGRDFHAGRHHPDGIYIAAGPGVESDRPAPLESGGGSDTYPGPVADFGTGQRARLIDIAPAVLSLLGVAREPADSSRIVSPDSTRAGDGRGHSPAADEVYTPQEREIIEQRLRDLGYF